MTTEFYIELKGAGLGYAGKTVLADLNLQFEKGKIHCLFGRNGSGKTTMLKSMASLIPVINGEIELDGSSIRNVSISERAKKMAIVLTERPHVSNITVKDFISYGRYPYSNWLGREEESDKEIVEECIKDCHLQDFVERELDSLSDGEMQKVQIARALAQNTELLLLDEIASHLDLVNRAEIFNLLKKINEKSNMTIVFSSHDIQFALQLAHNFTVIHNGDVNQYEGKEFSDKQIYKDILESPYLELGDDGKSLNFKAIT